MASKRTFTTDKLSHSESHLLNVSAFTASHRSSSRINLHQLRTACYSFVFQTFDKSTPRSVRYMFSKMVIPHHIFDLQILDSNKGMSLDYPVSQLESKIYSLIRNSFIQPAQSEPCFSLIGRAFDLSAYSSMQNLQFSFTFEQMSGIGYKLTIGESSKVLQADINSNFGFRSMNNFSFRHFTAENSKPLPSFVLLDSECFNLSFRDSVQDDWQIANLADLDVLAIQKLKSALRISYAINSTFVSGKSLFFAGFIFNYAKKISKGFMHPVGDILLGLGMDVIKFARKVFVKIKLVKRHISKLVSIFVERKNLVIN